MRKYRLYTPFIIWQKKGEIKAETPTHQIIEYIYDVSMNRLPRYIILAIIILLQCATSSLAQQFQWVTGGGTNQSSPNLNINPEGVYYMCTDPNGNVYALSNVGNNAIIADTFYRSSAYGPDRNILLTSYTCSGQMRWAKLIASSADECYPFGLVADSIGHIYMAGYLTNGTLHVGYDTVITGLTNDLLGLIQFDTTGHFNWIRYVGNNTLSSYIATGTTIGSLSLDNVNNVHFVPALKSNAPLLPSVTSIRGSYDLKYNSAGTLLSARRLQLDSTLLVTGTTIDRRSNLMYTYGYRNPLFTDSSTYNFLAAFDTNGNRMWLDTLGNSYPSTNNFTGILPDMNGHLYVSGNGYGYIIYQNDTTHPNYSPYISFIMKIDTTGDKKWIKQSNGNGAIGTVIALPNNKVASIGHFYVKEKCDIDSIVNVAPGSDPFVFIVDTAGNLVKLIGIHGDGYFDDGMAITSDAIGNIYIGGMVEDSIPNFSMPAYHTVGGNTDFFVLKYGIPCDCISTPLASFTSVGSSFTYTGTTTGLDSVVWHFGDGTTGTGLSISHAYAISDTFHVCEYTYAHCGIDSSCSYVVVIGVGVNDPVDWLNNVAIYPNPTADELIINGLTNTTQYRLLSLTGTSLYKGTLQIGNNSLNISKLPPGVYLLQLSNDNGARTTARVIKQ